jgi:hypothetical protein
VVSSGQLRAANRFLTAAEEALAHRAGNRFAVKVRQALGADGASSATIKELDAAGNTVSVAHRVVDETGSVIHQHQTHIGASGTERAFPNEWIQFPDIFR